MLKSLQNLRAFYYQVELSFEPKTVEFLKKLLNKEKLEFPFILHSKKELIHFQDIKEKTLKDLLPKCQIKETTDDLINSLIKSQHVFAFVKGTAM